MNWKIPLSDLDYDEEEYESVLNVLKSKWLTMGAVTQEFEQAFAKYNNVKHAIAVSNGTAALHLACLSIGIKNGDEVIVPSLTFVATANAIRYTGAVPVFADIKSLYDLTISPESIEQKISPKTKAIMVMHYGGNACDMKSILEIAKKYKLSIIEDACHAVGSELEGKKLGGWGDVGCFSFFPNKNMTTAEGGMVVTNNDEFAEKIRLMRSHGMTTVTWDRYKGRAQGYDVVELGYNYRIDEIRSALGKVQLTKLPKNNERRRQITSFYVSALKNTGFPILIPFENHHGISAAHIFPILLPSGIDRKRISVFLNNEKIQTSNHYPPVHLFSIFKNELANYDFNLPITEDVAMREMTLPLYPTMTFENVCMVADTLKNALKYYQGN